MSPFSLLYYVSPFQIQVLVQHVSNEVLEKIEAAAADLFLLEGQDALQRRVKEEEAKKVGRVHVYLDFVCVKLCIHRILLMLPLLRARVAVVLTRPPL
jgi:hypothetical protein